MQAVELRQYTMKRRLSALARRNLSAREFRFVGAVFQIVRFWWWCFSSYVPRLVASRLVKRTPRVHGFGAPLAWSHLTKKLQNVNVLAPTKVCRVMTKYGSDKSRSNNYTTVYSALLEDRCDQPLRILELGLGTNDPDAPSSMGVFGVPGASLRGWRELFPHALVFGADIDRAILFQEDRIKTFYCDQLDRSSIRELWSHADLQGGADIIIEDGLHTLEANVSFLEGSLDHLRPGGVYVAEDIAWNRLDEWYRRVETIYSKQYPTYEFAFVVLTNRAYNNLLVIRRAAN
jgi:SAM-dependent methyltransferase